MCSVACMWQLFFYMYVINMLSHVFFINIYFFWKPHLLDSQKCNAYINGSQHMYCSVSRPCTCIMLRITFISPSPGRIQVFFSGRVRWHNVPQRRRRHLGGRYGGGFGGPHPKKILNMKCSRSDSEHTWADLRLIRSIFKGHFIKFVFRDYELLEDRPGPRKHCNKFLSFHTIQFY